VNARSAEMSEKWSASATANESGNGSAGDCKYAISPTAF
jgi:hypothetical protein